MPEEQINKWDSLLHRLIIIAGCILIFVSALSITGWLTGIRTLVIFNSQLVPVSLTGSFFFLLFGLFFITGIKEFRIRFLNTAAKATFYLILFYSLLKFLGYFYSPAQVPSTLFDFLQDNDDILDISMMSPYSGLLFMLSCAAILLSYESKKSHVVRDISAGIGVLILVAGFVAGLGYLFGTPFFYTGSIIPLSSRSAFLFILTGNAILYRAGADNIFLRSMAGTSPYSQLLRIFIPFIIAAFLLQGIMEVLLVNYFGLNQAIVLVMITAISIAVGVSLIVYITKSIFNNATHADKERRRMMDDLRKSIAVQNQILHNSPLGICMVNDDSVLWSNKQFCEILNLPETSCQAVSFKYLLQSLSSGNQSVIQVSDLTDKNNIDNILQLKLEKGLSWCRFIGSLIETGESGKTSLWMIEDITERKQQREMMRLLSHTVASLTECVSITDISDRIIFVNKTFEKTYGYTSEELLGKNIRIVRPESNYQTDDDHVFSSTLNGGWSGEIINRKKDGSEFPVYLNTSRVLNDQNETIALVGVAFDITDIKEARRREQEYLEQLKDSNDAKDKLFSIISHDLRSPLSSILGFLRLLNEEYEIMSEKEKKKSFSELKESAENTFNLMENLLTWSRSQRGGMKVTPAEFNLRQIVTELTDLLRESSGRKRIELISHVDSEITVYADRDMIRTTLLNLLNNAIKFSRKDGRVTITSRISEDEIEVTVSDNGIGISPERLETIFRLDRSGSTPGTDNEKGTGLGLHICKEFIEKNRGRIWAESRLNEGSSFTFTIPVR